MQKHIYVLILLFYVFSGNVIAQDVLQIDNATADNITVDNITVDNATIDNITDVAVDNVTSDNTSIDNVMADNATIDNATQTGSEEVYYDEHSADFYSDDDVFELGDIEVTDYYTGASNLGKTTLPSEYIENMPRGNGGITDLLRAVPSVQYSEDYRSAENAGEIGPAEISISGGKSYENLFLVDGMSNSSMLGSASDNPYASDELASGSQKFNLDSWLIDELVVYDSNIPAEYDGFTGGVVEVETKQPTQEWGGSLSYRGTSSAMALYHVSPEITNKPIFEKHFISASLNVPILDDLGMLLSYKRSQSLIPKEFFTTLRSEDRSSDTFLAKATYNIDGLSHFTINGSYSPNSGLYFLKNVMNSDFVINGGGYFTNAAYTRETGLGGVLNITASYANSHTKRDAPNSFYTWVRSNNKPWGIYIGEDAASLEGGYGNLENYEQNASLKVKHNFDDIEFFGTHKINYGAGYDFVYAKEVRDEDAYYYSDPSYGKLVLNCNGQEGCLIGDQYFRSREVTPASTTEASIHKVNAYVTDSWKLERVSLNLGLRATYDDFMSNINISPRTSLDVDILNNDFTVLTFGYNRYYSGGTLAYRIRENRKLNYNESRGIEGFDNTVQDWTLTASDSTVVYNFSDLKTPYSDEFLAAITQDVFSSKISIKYIERFGKDEIATDRTIGANSNPVYKLSNRGESHYRSAQVRWSKSWTNHYLMANTSWQQSTTSNDSYTDQIALEDMEEDIILDGKIIKAYQLPADNFNRPFIVNMGYTGRFYDHLAISLNAKFSTGYQQIELTDNVINEETSEGEAESLEEYETVTYKPSIIFDLAITWTQPIYKNHKLIINAEISNLFNTKNEISSGTAKAYEIGTQLWLGATYEF